MNVVRENPGADFNAGAGFQQALPGNAKPLQAGQPAAVDLHQADIQRIFVAADRRRIEAGLRGGNGPEHMGVNAVFDGGRGQAIIDRIRRGGRAGITNQQGKYQVISHGYYYEMIFVKNKQDFSFAGCPQHGFTRCSAKGG